MGQMSKKDIILYSIIAVLITALIVSVVYVPKKSESALNKRYEEIEKQILDKVKKENQAEIDKLLNHINSLELERTEIHKHYEEVKNYHNTYISNVGSYTREELLQGERDAYRFLDSLDRAGGFFIR